MPLTASISSVTVMSGVNSATEVPLFQLYSHDLSRLGFLHAKLARRDSFNALGRRENGDSGHEPLVQGDELMLFPFHGAYFIIKRRIPARLGDAGEQSERNGERDE